MKALRRGLSCITVGLTWLLETALILAIASMTLVVLWGVFSRYALGDPSQWTEELAQFLLMWTALLGAPVAYGRKAHLGVDYLVKKLDPAAQRLNGVIVNLLVIAFAGLVMVRGGFILVNETLIADQRTAALGLPMGSVYLAAPISGLFFILYALQQIAESTSSTTRIPETTAPEPPPEGTA